MKAILSGTTDDSNLQRFLKALETWHFGGELGLSHAQRTVFATDNSIYERLPKAVLFPREPEDLNRIMRAAQETRTAIAARGGGTGTNGQSLSDSVIVDCSRYLSRILGIDPATRTAVVEPGVILDELNRAAAPHGLFFGPTVSTASRATLGGMAATDASGKGSRIFGRTSDHVLSMDVVLSDGSDWQAAPLDAEGFAAVCERDDLPGLLHSSLRDILDAETDEIARVFPIMNRGLTGYNLKEIRDDHGVFRLSKLLCGSEGTLALTKRLNLRLLKKKPLRALMVVAYDDAMAALSDVERLVAADPVAVEFIDDKILGLAQSDPVWADIEAVLSHSGKAKVGGLNFVEVQADDDTELERAIERLGAIFEKRPSSVLDERVVRDPHVISQLWSLREKCVGLLGRMDKSRQGTPFVEDAAVPPQNLGPFVKGFRDMLDSHGLAYGMFGHADVGCVHVRPALDMRRPDDAAMIRKVSDAVAALAQSHGGLIWGEHGKGVRGEYVPMVFGARLYDALCRIKNVCDPHGILNPGKIANPNPKQALKAIDEVPFRGSRDAQIDSKMLGGFELSVRCNGNGQCFNRNFDDAMCPSYKATGDRTKSPKGRAALIREWLRLRSDIESGGIRAKGARRLLPELEAALHESLSDCLGCKACASQCPVKVDIPAMRSRFWASYYQRHRRPLRHYLLGGLETLGPLMRLSPAFTNVLMHISGPLLSAMGLVDLPNVSTPKSARGAFRRHGADDRTVVLVEDTFLATFDGAVIDACQALLENLGYRVVRTAPLPNGKAQHVLGFKSAFEKAAGRRSARLEALAKEGYPLIGIEPVVQAMESDEYGSQEAGKVAIVSIDRFLEGEILAGRIRWRTLQSDRTDLPLYLHCTENASDPGSANRWQAIFAAFGLSVNPLATGCCGMAGTFGHEREHAEMSRKIYDLSWRQRIEEGNGPALVTGFSCRCQVKRFSGKRAQHPVELLAAKSSG
ncbi:FAD-binding and (Fe-S)-binding domain-containing protein [Ciceribacter sp. RN22]|uniref:FAD-binding and (Fe-S)-binding domain-containing protein n=1 Tax=Ciceribacter sp. RN22 TaxID=2954932 RepID=UPI0020934B24|nr:FAD-binding and (Fe-S)-binding domain-containing protein [Ciceribacter sp. RN22]MCO6179641.1 FAD-binding oxidoreductase [Ciceribacter sp. RN22]